MKQLGSGAKTITVADVFCLELTMPATGTK